MVGGEGWTCDEGAPIGEEERLNQLHAGRWHATAADVEGTPETCGGSLPGAYKDSGAT